MSKTMGVIPLKKLDEYEKELKQNLLLFDYVGVISMDALLDIGFWHHDRLYYDYIEHTLLLLQQKKLLISLFKQENVAVIEREFLKDIKERPTPTYEDSFVSSNASMMHTEVMAKSTALLLQLYYPDIIAVPLISDLPKMDKPTSKGDVMKLIIEKIPIPDDDTPWEAILEFKSDADNIGRMAKLRRWINNALKSNNSPGEIKDEIEALLYDYRKSLEYHKIKSNSGILKSILVGSAEIIENISKLQFSTLAKGLFSIGRSTAELTHAELTAPGNELAYIYKAQEKFSKP